MKTFETDYVRVMRKRDNRRHFRTAFWCVIAFCVVILFARCTPVSTDKTIVTISEPGPSYFVHEVHLKDGTRCVVSTSYSGDGGTGIDCEWKDRQ